jgi:hypothetical protein
MAEIRVEPQRGGRGWLWLLIVLLIIVAVAVWYFSGNRGTTSAPPSTTGARDNTVIGAGGVAYG